MNIDFNHYNPNALYTNARDMMLDYWKQLTEEFGYKQVPFMLTEFTEELVIRHNILKMLGVEEVNRTEWFIGDIIKVYQDPYVIMHTEFFGVCKNKEPIQVCTMSNSRLVELIWYHLPNYDELMDFLKLSLRHEMGHLLVNRNIAYENDDIFAAAKKITDIVKEQNNMWAQFVSTNGSKHDDNFFRVYHELPMEKMANDMVGLTWKDHVDANNAIMKGIESNE